MIEPKFLDRRGAGRRLAYLLDTYRGMDAVVVPLSGGSVVMAREMARRLGAALDVVAAHSIRAPFAPDEKTVRAAREEDPSAASGRALQALADEELRLLEPWMAFCSQYASAPEVGGRTVLIVENGMISGLGVLAAVRAFRLWKPASIVVAARIGSRGAVARVAAEADQVMCLTYDSDPESDRDMRAIERAVAAGIETNLPGHVFREN